MFDLPVQTDNEYKTSLIKNIFGSGGKATMKLIDKHGKKYTISRIYGEKVNVLNENGEDINVSAASLLDGVQYFGQKDWYQPDPNFTADSLNAIETANKDFLVKYETDMGWR